MAELGEANIGGRMVPAWILNGNANGLDISESSEYPGCFYRKLADGTIEWFNPPMLLGAEYRTVERYQGKPVYTQIITVDGGVAGAVYHTEKSVSGADQLVGYGAKLWGWSIPTRTLGGQFDNPQAIVDATARVSSSFIECYFCSPGRNTTGSTVYFTVRYIKSTD